MNKKLRLFLTLLILSSSLTFVSCQKTEVKNNPTKETKIENKINEIRTINGFKIDTSKSFGTGEQIDLNMNDFVKNVGTILNKEIAYSEELMFFTLDKELDNLTHGYNIQILNNMEDRDLFYELYIKNTNGKEFDKPNSINFRLYKGLDDTEEKLKAEVIKTAEQDLSKIFNEKIDLKDKKEIKLMGKTFDISFENSDNYIQLNFDLNKKAAKPNKEIEKEIIEKYYNNPKVEKIFGKITIDNYNVLGKRLNKDSGIYLDIRMNLKEDDEIDSNRNMLSLSTLDILNQVFIKKDGFTLSIDYSGDPTDLKTQGSKYVEEISKILNLSKESKEKLNKEITDLNETGKILELDGIKYRISALDYYIEVDTID